MKDIKRVFMYHSVEHKTIFCYEKGEELRLRMCAAIPGFIGWDVLYDFHADSRYLYFNIYSVKTPILRTGIKLLTIPVVVGIGYELSSLRAGRPACREISTPGIWLQRITTKVTDDMIEVAIRLSASCPETARIRCKGMSADDIS